MNIYGLKFGRPLFSGFVRVRGITRVNDLQLDVSPGQGSAARRKWCLVRALPYLQAKQLETPTWTRVKPFYASPLLNPLPSRGSHSSSIPFGGGCARV